MEKRKFPLSYGLILTAAHNSTLWNKQKCHIDSFDRLLSVTWQLTEIQRFRHGLDPLNCFIYLTIYSVRK